jgi:glycosyltransferase involved in cell wall biosynthesis
MSPYPKVSIITPSYNQAPFLESTIQSILNQSYPNLEYILIDGGSSDGSKAIIERYADHFAYWVSEPDKGQAHAINKGLRKSSGQFIGWLNADDILLPETVSAVVQAFNDDPNVDVVYGKLDRINQVGIIIPTPLLPKDKVVFSRELIIGECVVNQPGSFWRKEWLDRVGYLDERLHFGLDYEYWIRMALAGAKFMRLPQVVAQFRLSSGSKTVSRTEEMALEQMEILNHTLRRDDLMEKTGLSDKQIRRKARMTKAVISLHAFYGYVKNRDIQNAAYWFLQAIMNDPSIILSRRWFDLAVARLRRSNASR